MEEMHPRWFIAVAALSASGPAASLRAAPVSYVRDVAPILNTACTGCHRPAKMKGKLDLSSYESLVKGGKSGACVRPGQPGESLLWQSISGSPPDMPNQGEPLSARDVGVIRRWIEEGAKNDGTAESSPKTLISPVYHSLPAVTALTFCGTNLLAVAGHSEVLLYDTRGQLKGRLLSELPRIDAMAVSPVNSLLAVTACDPSVRSEVELWDTERQAIVRSIPAGTDSLFGLSFSPDGRRVAMGGADRIVRVFATETGQELVHFANHTDWVFGASFSSDGKYIVTGGRDSTLRVLEASSGRFLSALAPEWEGILCVAVNPRAPEVVYGGEKGGVRVYKLNPQEGFKDPGENKLHVRDYDHLDAPVYAIAYSPDGKWVAIGGERDEVRVHQADNGARKATLRGHAGAIFALSFNPQGDQVAAAGQDGKVRIYEAASGKKAAEFNSVPLEGRSPSTLSSR